MGDNEKKGVKYEQVFEKAIKAYSIWDYDMVRVAMSIA